MWNLAYDGGMGLGEAGFGVLATRTGYPAAFALTAALMSAVLLPIVLLPAVLAAVRRGRERRLHGAGARAMDRSG
jgi:Cu/Ag efflux pump CusA